MTMVIGKKKKNLNMKQYMWTDLDKRQNVKSIFVSFLIYVHVIYDDTVFVWVLQNVLLQMQN